MDKQYSENRKAIPAEIKREVETNAGHNCSVKNCPEHTYLEIHHIDFNRENNDLENLILLCDKHHKMAHKKIIDRKSLRVYKDILNENNTIINRIEQLEKTQKNLKDTDIESTNEIKAQFDENTSFLSGPRRASLISLTLCQLALSKYETETNDFYLRQANLKWKNTNLKLDALFYEENNDTDKVIDVIWLRKRYLDTNVYIKNFEERLSIYEYITKRKAKGIILFIMGKDYLKNLEELPQINKAIKESTRRLTVKSYGYSDLGYRPTGIAIPEFKSIG